MRILDDSIHAAKDGLHKAIKANASLQPVLDQSISGLIEKYTSRR